MILSLMYSVASLPQYYHYYQTITSRHSAATGHSLLQYYPTALLTIDALRAINSDNLATSKWH